MFLKAFKLRVNKIIEKAVINICKKNCLLLSLALLPLISVANPGEDYVLKIDSLCDVGIDLAPGHPDSSLTCFEKACSISVQHNYLQGQCKGYFLKSCILTDFSKYDEARECLDIAYPLSFQIGDSLRTASCLNGYALIYLYQNQYDSAHHYFTQMKLLSSEMGHSFLENSALLNLSAIYNETGMFAESVETIFQAIEYFESNKVNFETAICYQNLGSAYLGLKDTLNALKYFNEAIPLYQAIDNQFQYSEDLQNIGVIYMGQGDFEKANEYLAKAIKVSDSLGYMRGKATGLAQLGILKVRTGDVNSAMVVFDSAMVCSNEINLPDNRDFILFQLGKMYFGLREYRKALQYLRQAATNAENYGNRELLMDVRSLESKIYKSLGDYKKALNAKEESLHIENSIRSEDNVRKATLLEKNYEFKLKSEQLVADAKIQQEQILSKLNLQKIYKLFALTLLVVVSTLLLVILFDYFQKKKAYNQLIKKNVALVEAYKKLRNCKINDKTKRVTDEKMKEIIVRLEKLINKKQIFLEQELTQQKLALELETNSSYLSEVINNYYGKNFTTFINEKRIEYSILMLSEGKFNKFSIEGVAMASGFTNRSTFHRAFKKVTGVNPSYYIENQESVMTGV